MAAASPRWFFLSFSVNRQGIKPSNPSPYKSFCVINNSTAFADPYYLALLYSNTNLEEFCAFLEDRKGGRIPVRVFFNSTEEEVITSSLEKVFRDKLVNWSQPKDISFTTLETSWMQDICDNCDPKLNTHEIHSFKSISVQNSPRKQVKENKGISGFDRAKTSTKGLKMVNELNETEKRFVEAWEDSVELRNILLFSHLRYPADYIRDHCTVSGTNIELWRDRLSNKYALLKSGSAPESVVYELIPGIENVVDQVFMDDFGMSHSELDELRRVYFQSDSPDTVNEKFRADALSFFTPPFIPGARVTGRSGSFSDFFRSISVVIEHGNPKTLDWKFLLIFVPDLGHSPHSKEILGEISNHTVEAKFEPTMENSARFLITPFLGHDMLHTIEQRTTSNIYCLDAISVAYMRNKAIKELPLKTEQAARMGNLTRGQASGLFDLRRRWRKVMGETRNGE